MESETREFKLENRRVVQLGKDNYGTVDIQLDLADIVDSSFSDFLDKISMVATGSYLLQDITYEIVEGKGTTITLRIKGDFTEIMDVMGS